MTDSSLRDLERRWRLTGSGDDLARLLDARARAGLIARERIELAAWMGHEGALTAIGGALPETPPWETWASALDAGVTRVFLLHASRALDARLDTEHQHHAALLASFRAALDEALALRSAAVDEPRLIELLRRASAFEGSIWSVELFDPADELGLDFVGPILAAHHLPLITTHLVTALHAVATSEHDDVRRALLAWALGS